MSSQNNVLNNFSPNYIQRFQATQQISAKGLSIGINNIVTRLSLDLNTEDVNEERHSDDRKRKAKSRSSRVLAKWKENKDSEEVSVFDNCLTDTEATLSFIDLNSESTDLHKENKHSDQTKDIEEDSDNIASGRTYFDDLDETDYFDSEDEYWDTLRDKDIKEEICQHCQSYHLPRSIQDEASCECCHI